MVICWYYYGGICTKQHPDLYITYRRHITTQNNNAFASVFYEKECRQASHLSFTKINFTISINVGEIGDNLWMRIRLGETDCLCV